MSELIIKNADKKKWESHKFIFASYKNLLVFCFSSGPPHSKNGNENKFYENSSSKIQ